MSSQELIDEAGKGPGLEIWRIEEMELALVPRDQEKVQDFRFLAWNLTVELITVNDTLYNGLSYGNRISIAAFETSKIVTPITSMVRFTRATHI